MSLTTRLSLVFVAVLGLVLLGFSLALYGLADFYLHRQAEAQLDAALDALAASMEVRPEGVEWEPAERLIRVNQSGGGLRWAVSDGGNRVIDQSDKFDAPGLLAITSIAGGDVTATSGKVAWEGTSWLAGRRVLTKANVSGAPVTPRPPDAEAKLHSKLVISAALTLEPVGSTLRLLAFVLLGLSGGLWAVCWLGARRVCRRALQPLRRLADEAGEMDVGQMDQALQVPPANDELREFALSFNALLTRLRESFERQRRFTGDASHQLRTPLAAMIGQLDVALRRDRSPEDYHSVLRTVREKAERLRRIVEALLFLARANTESRRPEQLPVNLGDWLRGYLLVWKDHARGVDIRFESSGEPLWVSIPPELFGELMNILLDNALKFSNPGTAVTVELTGKTDHARLTVHDRGIGIPGDDLPHLFMPFFQSESARLRGVEGVGLGLSIAKRIADVCGATLEVSSTPGEGTSFSLTLPVSNAPTSQKERDAGLSTMGIQAPPVSSFE